MMVRIYVNGVLVNEDQRTVADIEKFAANSIVSNSEIDFVEVSVYGKKYKLKRSGSLMHIFVTTSASIDGEKIAESTFETTIEKIKHRTKLSAKGRSPYGPQKSSA
jgi:hypothetical protein